MHSKQQVETTVRTAAPRARALLLAAPLVLAAGTAMPRVSDAAEFKLSGNGSFKPPSAAQLAALPVDLGFSRADLESGTWSFSLRYDDSLPDKDPDPYAARYVGAVGAARLVIGGTTLDLPAEQTEIVVSDGGGAFPNREMIRLEARMATPSGTLRLSWVQAHQQAKGADLRGPAGVLQGDALPAAAMLANLNTASAFDKFLELRIDRSAGDPTPLLYLSSSKLTVSAGPATTP
ncbi:MAG TPA: hypothetical protein VJ832_08480 [Variovorax sp.]|nr:hypothetical protein [Variovorax sp.]